MKPKEILELEKIYNIQIEETHSKEEIVSFDKRNVYLVNKGKVVGLNLSGNKISSIKGLTNFKSLLYLNLYKNSIELVENLENQLQLEVLYLGENRIVKIKDLNNTALRVIDLHNNKITKTKGLEKLKNLEEIYLMQNQLKEIDHIQNNNQLKTLDLSFNHLMEIDFSLFKNMDLKKLNIRNNWINRMKNIPDGKGIEYINLKHNQIEDLSSIQSIMENYALYFINVEGNPFLEATDLHIYGYGYENHLKEMRGLFNL
ncbi:leucine-rich repeat domain-containing protein [Chryseobacterium arthrosphaerae]|nr:leucine-rich repeat domain-containing protein [Chryseobacterium arthrosphaerae]